MNRALAYLHSGLQILAQLYDDPRYNLERSTTWLCIPRDADDESIILLPRLTLSCKVSFFASIDPLSTVILLTKMQLLSSILFFLIL